MALSICQDTIIICWPIDRNKIPSRYTVINEIVKDTNSIMNWGIQNEFLFRGAFGIGECIVNKDAILGPAVFDANEWQNKAEWFGILFSPKSQIWVESAIEERDDENPLAALVDSQNQDRDNFSRLAVYHSVPLKTIPGSIKPENSEKFLVIGWPSFYNFVKNGKRYYRDLINETKDHLVETRREFILDKLFNTYSSDEARIKYRNSLAFLDEYYKRFPPLPPPSIN
jgi:hypothetical protein